MTVSSDIYYQQGFAGADRPAAAILYDQAFGSKLGVAIPNRETRLAVLEHSFQPQFCIAAFEADRLVGLAGFHTAEGSLTGGTLSGNMPETAPKLGLWGGLRAALILALYERKAQPGELLMDGLVVHEDMRGRGVGSKLLERLTQYGHEHGFDYIRLNVINTNPAAKRLYERRGFQEVRTTTFPYLKWLLGFSAETTMHFPLNISPTDKTQ
ncbi:MAG: GNAT family N-acetyltransferase [Deinococcota bacterium]